MKYLVLALLLFGCTKIVIQEPEEEKESAVVNFNVMKSQGNYLRVRIDLEREVRAKIYIIDPFVEGYYKTYQRGTLDTTYYHKDITLDTQVIFIHDMGSIRK